jgi:hypothetical protein
MMTPEQRLDRAEYILVRLAKSGRQARTEFRQKINMLINAQMRNEEAWRAESDATNEKLNILIRTQMDTSEQIKRTDEQLKQTGEQLRQTDEQVRQTGEQLRQTDEHLKQTDEQIRDTVEQVKALALAQADLAQSQKLTDQTLRAFINSLRKRGNGNS